MPIQPGALFSVLLMILCLGINIVSYPQVAQEFRSQEHRTETAVKDAPAEKQEIAAAPILTFSESVSAPLPDPISPLTASPVPVEKIPVPLIRLPPVEETPVSAEPSNFVGNRQTGPDAAFLPLVPQEMENDYWQERSYDPNRLLVR